MNASSVQSRQKLWIEVSDRYFSLSGMAVGYGCRSGMAVGMAVWYGHTIWHSHPNWPNLGPNWENNSNG